MKRILIISILSLVAVAASVETAEAQLITDSDKRLKTAEKEKKGFLFGLFNKDKRSQRTPRQQAKSSKPRSSSSPFASFRKQSVSPRYTEIDRGSLFRSKRTAPSSYSSGPPSFSDVFTGPPRYSMGSPFSNKRKSITPRYSPGSPFRKSSYAASPRYSTGPRFDRKAMPMLPPRSVSGKSPFSGFQFVQPRYSPGNPFDNKRITVTPRSISGSSPFSKKDMTVNPRYSSGSPFSKSRYDVTPRYSSPLRFSKRDMAINGPRYSSPLRFSKKDLAVRSPRYSSPMRFSKKDLAVNPRYSSPLRFSKRDMAVNPRYSSPLQFSKQDKTVNPRYSKGLQFTRRDKQVNPRYSAGMEFTRKDLSVSTRYSKEKDLTVRKKKISPRYSTYEDRFEYDHSKKYSASEGTAFEGTHRKKKDWYENLEDLAGTWKSAHFKGPTKVPYVRKENYKDDSKELSSFEGTFKEKWINNHKMHPSFNHHRADNSGELFSESMRRWNIFWARLNGNKAQPDAVKEKVSKPKFDRKETDIWNE